MTLEFNGTCNTIHAISASEVWIGCGKGKVWHTSDGGQQWQTFTLSPDGGEISDIDVAGTTVWASNTLSEVHRGSGCVGTDLSSCTWSRTEFNGSDVYPPGFWQNPQNQANGGRESAPPMRAIAAVSDTTAWAAGDFGEYTNYGCLPQILKTTDGGASWQKQHINLNGHTGGIGCLGIGIVGMDAIDENNAVVIAAGRYGDTTDGGLTWNVRTNFSAGSQWHGSVKMIDAMNVWAQSGKTIRRTTGGSPWRGVVLVKCEQWSGDKCSLWDYQAIGGNSVYDLDAVDIETAVVVGEYGRMFRTHNGGAEVWQWREVTNPFPNSSDSTIFAVSILNGGDTGWAVGQSGDDLKVIRR